MVLSLPIRTRASGLLPLPSPNSRRIAAWSGALALHVLVVGLLLLPRLPLEILPPPSPEKAMEAITIPVVPIRPDPLPQPLPTVEPVRRVPVPVPVAPVAPVVVVVEDPTFAVPATLPPIDIADPSPAETDIVPVGTTQAIAIDSVTAPPYPGRAARRGLEGTVMLRVLIGADGLPRKVEVERSSGHSELDRAARLHVTEQWRFHPALERGQPVSAWVRVPIAFSLRR